MKFIQYADKTTNRNETKIKVIIVKRFSLMRHSEQTLYFSSDNKLWVIVYKIISLFRNWKLKLNFKLFRISVKGLRKLCT